MVKEFKQFIARGNVIDLAVGVIVGAAFTAIVNSLVKNIINPLLGLLVGRIDLSNLVFKIGESTFRYGSFINSIINFIIIAFVVFLIVKVINKITRREEKKKTVPTSEDYLREIRDLLEKQNTK
ncbi:MAG: large-conductance mechanosensitive channel protein MscL [Candidatus Lactobacillus pullistercoris]|uniref:Large-conductance mechanosensitive channel n=1 Tax=Candidatus Lactobacillus pullistercoris TaxID=2838636 RepID=A0A9E2NTD8_9LACO|nr:large-conductance mechanosensitive channel protein MscL [Candidatus Lactobacillus pullistercoris]